MRLAAAGAAGAAAAKPCNVLDVHIARTTEHITLGTLVADHHKRYRSCSSMFSCAMDHSRDQKGTYSSLCSCSRFCSQRSV